MRKSHLMCIQKAACQNDTSWNSILFSTFWFSDKFLGAGAASDGSVSVVEYAGVETGAALAMLIAPAGVD